MIFGNPKDFAELIGVSVELVQGINLLWIALREPLPRPLDTTKFYNFAQTVKARYERELPWMEDDFSPTLHKICDHPKEVIDRLPVTLHISMLNEEAKEGKE